MVNEQCTEGGVHSGSSRSNSRTASCCPAASHHLHLGQATVRLNGKRPRNQFRRNQFRHPALTSSSVEVTMSLNRKAASRK